VSSESAPLTGMPGRINLPRILYLACTFPCRQRAIFTRDGVAEILNLQPRGGKAKAYQVKQVRGVLTSYGLAGEPEAEEAASEGVDSTKTEEGDGE